MLLYLEPEVAIADELVEAKMPSISVVWGRRPQGHAQACQQANRQPDLRCQAPRAHENKAYAAQRLKGPRGPKQEHNIAI